MRFLLLSVGLLFFYSSGYSQIYISEVSDASSYHQEFMEIYNNTDNDLDLHGYKIIQVDVNSDTAQYVYDIGTNESSSIPGSDFIISSHGFMIIARGSSLADFESVWGTLPTGVAFNVGNTKLYFGASGATYRWRLRANDGTADTDDGTLLDDTGQAVGGSGYRDYQQKIGGPWIQDSYQNATPGYFDNDQSLPVTLTSFTALVQNSGVVLQWRTESEVENIGFEIYRSLNKEEGYQLLSSFRDNADLKGQLNASRAKTYRYTDVQVQAGQTYFYKLADVALNGQRTFHGPIKVLVQNAAVSSLAKNVTSFKLYPNYPNPFNPTTDIVFDLPAVKEQSLQTFLNIYDVNGRKVRSLLQKSLPAGQQYRVQWDGRDDSGHQLSAGIYFAVLQAGNFRQSMKMCLMK